MYEQKQLFDFILDRVEDTGAENGLKSPQAFGRWFAGMYFDKPQNFSISDGSGDGKVDLFFQTSNGKEDTAFRAPDRFRHTSSSRCSFGSMVGQTPATSTGCKSVDCLHSDRRNHRCCRVKCSRVTCGRLRDGEV